MPNVGIAAFIGVIAVVHLFRCVQSYLLYRFHPLNWFRRFLVSFVGFSWYRRFSPALPVFVVFVGFGWLSWFWSVRRF